MLHALALDGSSPGGRAPVERSPWGRALYEIRRPPIGGRATGPLPGEPLLRLAEDLRAHGRRHFGAGAEAAGLATTAGTADPGTGERLSRALGGIPVALADGVRAAGLAEGRLGAGRPRDRFLFVSVGRTIGGAIGLGGGIEPGAGRAGEIGHVTVRPGGPPCACGRSGCLETLASTAAITRAWRRAGGRPGADALACARAVEAGDASAARVWREAVDALADALITALTILDPGTLLIGGALATTGDTLLVPLREAVTERLTFQRRPVVAASRLGDTAACLGAALLARDLVT
ncbi:ROK family protein [Streptomyces sp. NPDC058052]|uniref:ROK family protein n=1 Tax=Streptomyces sp. NPDC058052 TaxID=3346316 RepID=UPI0036E13568